MEQLFLCINCITRIGGRMILDLPGVAQRLRMARITLGISQMDAAKIIGKNQSYISRCEAGLKDLSINELALFSKLYGKSIEYFFSGEETE